MRKRSFLSTVTGLVMVALVATGCGSGSSDDDSEGSDAQPLTIGMPNGTISNNSNPFFNDSAARKLGYGFMMYEPLVQPNLINPTAEPEPWLASEWTHNDDYSSFTFTTRPDVTWSDGEDFTAEDIAFTWQLIKDNEELNLDALPIDQITTEGDDVTVTFEGGQFTQQEKVLRTFIVPEHIWADVADPAKELNQEPVGTGPYVLNRWSAQSVSLTPNEDYWGGDPAVPELRYTSYNDNNGLTTALATGKAQWGWTFIADYEEVYIAKDPENHKFWGPTGLGIDALFVNTATKPFNDVAVRKAVSLVIDRDAIHTTAAAKVFPRLYSPTGLPEPAGESYIADKYKGQEMNVDVEGAKKVLTDAGYTYDGDTLVDPSGAPVTFTMNDPAGWTDYLATLQIIADSVKKIGIGTEIRQNTGFDDYNQQLQVGDFQASLHWSDGGLTPFNLYSSTMDGAHYKPVGEVANWNYGRYNNPAATEALKTYKNTADEAERTAALNTLQDIFVDELPVIPSIGRPDAAEYSTKNYVGWPSEEDPYASPQPTNINVSMVVMKLRPKS